MRTGLQLLDALALGPGGVQVNVTKTGVTVTTRYTPLVRGDGETLIEATSKAVQEVVEYQKEYGNVPKQVLAAIRMYVAENKIRTDSI